MGTSMAFTDHDKLVASIHSDHTYAKTECPQTEAVAHIKEEVDCEDSWSSWETSGVSETGTHADFCGVSSAAARVGLYAGHAVKDELVVGPECLQPPDAAFALCAASDWARDSQFSNLVENSEWESKIYRTPTDGAGAEVFRCCMCCATFAQRPLLLAHAQAHVHTPAHGEVLNVSFALALRECSVRLARCDDRRAADAARPSYEYDIYECDECGATYPEKSKLFLHIRTHSRFNTTRAEESKRPCVDSESDFAHKFRLRWRKAERVEGKRVEPISCDVCGKQCQYPSQLAQHKRTHDDQKFACEICGMNFKYLESHLKTHAGKTLKSHVKRKAPSGPFTCKVCKKNFTNIKNFQLHERVHTGEKPYSCQICKKQFAFPSNYFSHMRIHLQIKPYSCKFCKKRFTILTHLKQHEPIHTGVKAYPCGICPAKFARPRNLKQHMLSHLAVKPHRCATCNKTFALIHQLRKHEQTHKCKLCKKEFASLIDLNIHWRVHLGVMAHTCELCHAQFKTLHALRRHLRGSEKRRAADPAAECVVRRIL